MSEALQLRIHGNEALLTLVYLPGLHGDWTLIGRFRQALGTRVRFVEITYPRTLTWSLDDYAVGVENALAEHGVHRAWLLGESFGSQIAWPILQRKRFQVDGVILAGGFVRHPVIWGVRLAERMAGTLPLGLIVQILFGYARLVRIRNRGSPELAKSIEEFIARRTPLDLRAAQHRLHLLVENDPRPVVKETAVPIYALTGFFDPIVPWFWVRSWLRKHCQSLRDYRIVVSADHNVLGTATELSANQVANWIQRPRCLGSSVTGEAADASGKLRPFSTNTPALH